LLEQEDDFADRYPHRVTDAREDFFGSAIYSRHPLERPERISIGGRPTVRAAVLVDGRPVELVAVHTIQPLADLGTLRRQLAELHTLADRHPGPLVLAGDFNATPQHRGFRNLLSGGLTDSHIDGGRGLARTWPANLPVPPFALLDHVLVSPELVTRDVDELRLPGSDHRGVRAELQLR
jgi:endonuclease/exonuclease/phosphatase (EEP) superfamily protein YafD